MDKEVHGISYDGVIYHSLRTDSEYKVTSEEAFSKEMVNPLKTIDGTVGSMHRKHLHDLLDEWIDNAIKKGQQ